MSRRRDGLPSNPNVVQSDSKPDEVMFVPVVTLTKMKRLFVALTALLLIAASPEEAISDLEANGYYIEAGSNASEEVVSDAVFEGRADGGRLYITVLSDEPPGGAPTFADSVLDLLDGEGYVLTVAPETVGWAGDGTFWTAEEMDAATDSSLDGSSDDEVVERFVATLTGQPGGGEPGPGTGESSGGGISFFWILVVGAVILAVWFLASRRSRDKRMAERIEKVRQLAKKKLDEVANDILEMEDEVALSESAEVKSHYQRASEMYARATEDTTNASTITEMLNVSEELDLAIWELDCAEALLDGKPKPARPKPPPDEPVMPPSPEASRGEEPKAPMSAPGTVDQFDRRPQRQSSGSNDMLTMLLAMMAMRGMGRGGGFGGSSGGGRMGGGGFRGGGGGMRGGGGRIRGGGRRG